MSMLLRWSYEIERNVWSFGDQSIGVRDDEKSIDPMVRQSQVVKSWMARLYRHWKYVSTYNLIRLGENKLFSAGPRMHHRHSVPSFFSFSTLLIRSLKPGPSVHRCTDSIASVYTPRYFEVNTEFYMYLKNIKKQKGEYPYLSNPSPSLPIELLNLSYDYSWGRENPFSRCASIGLRCDDWNKYPRTSLDKKKKR